MYTEGKLRIVEQKGRTCPVEIRYFGDGQIASDGDVIAEVYSRKYARLFITALANGCKGLNPEGVRDLYEACNLFLCNIDFVKSADERSKDLLNVLKNNIKQALAKVKE